MGLTGGGCNSAHSIRGPLRPIEKQQAMGPLIMQSSSLVLLSLIFCFIDMFEQHLKLTEVEMTSLFIMYFFSHRHKEIPEQVGKYIVQFVFVIEKNKCLWSSQVRYSHILFLHKHSTLAIC